MLVISVQLLLLACASISVEQRGETLPFIPYVKDAGGYGEAPPSRLQADSALYKSRLMLATFSIKVLDAKKVIITSLY